MVSRRVFFLCLLASVMPAMPHGFVFAAVSAKPSFTLWQLPEQTGTQMMSYVLRTPNGKVIVIDGGTRGDAAYLRKFLKEQGDLVEAWFISHPHGDHIEAITEILAHPDGLRINRIYASLPDEDWERQNDPAAVSENQQFKAAVRGAGQVIINLVTGAVFIFDGVRIEVLAVKNPEIVANAGNNSSVVLRVSDAKKSVLFLGDLGYEAGEKLLHGKYRSRLHADYVQMAHHGQNGVGEDVYREINPSYCLWPTPRWLWDNNAGKGKGSGPWLTLDVRAWMDKLNIKHHYVSADGLQRIE